MQRIDASLRSLRVRPRPAVDAERLRAARTALGALIGLVWSVSWSAIREFVWADVKAGLLDLRGFSRATRSLVILGFGLLFLTVAALLFNENWRNVFPLVPMTIGTPGRGSMVPLGLLPMTMFLLTIAWSFALTGALHSHWLIRLFVLFLYLFNGITWNGMGVVGRDTDYGVAIGLLTLLAVPIVFVVRWRARPRPAVEFGGILALVSTTMALAQARTVESLEQSGVAVGIATMASNVVSLGALVLPLLLLIGMNIADFSRRAAGWAADIATDRFPAWLVRVVLGVVALWRLSAVLGDLVAAIGRNSLQATLLGYLGAALIPLGVWGVWFLAMRLRRRAQDDPLTSDDIAEAAEATTPKLVLAYVGVPMLTIILLDLGLALLAVPGQARSAQVNAMIAMANVFRDQSDTWQAILQVAMLLAVIPLASRGRDDLALYLGAFGARGVWLWLTGTNRPLAALGWTSPQPVELWWVLTFVGFGLVWLWRRRLTTERAGRLIYLLLITYLLGQTDFISNPFSPFFSFAGIGFVAFGIVWDAVTIGSWANHESPGLPRISRIFLYLGYVLVTVALINWVLTAHDLKELDRFTGQTALSGLNLFGKPLLYAIFAATLMLPARTEAGTATGDTD